MPYVYVSPNRDIIDPWIRQIADLSPAENINALEGQIMVILGAWYPGIDKPSILEPNHNPSELAGEIWFGPALSLANRLKDMDGLKQGDINYAITALIIETWFADGKPGYSKINDVVGVLTFLRTVLAPIVHPFEPRLVQILGILRCAEHEFLRRVHDPYENLKLWENTDCYPEEIAEPIPDRRILVDDPSDVL